MIDLQTLTFNDEEVAAYSVALTNLGGPRYEFIVSAEVPLEKQDLAQCFENTLHRLLDEGATPDDEAKSLGLDWILDLRGD